MDYFRCMCGKEFRAYLSLHEHMVTAHEMKGVGKTTLAMKAIEYLDSKH